MLQTFPLKRANSYKQEEIKKSEICQSKVLKIKKNHHNNILTDYHGCSVTIMIAFHGEKPNFLRLITKNALYKSNFHTY